MQIEQYKQSNSRKKKIFYTISAIIAVIIIYLLLRGCQGNRNLDALIAEYQKRSLPILESVWNHYKTHENFEGDWWSGKFKHPKMIDDDGAPYAFMDSIDIDKDGLSDIDWSNPTKNFELLVVSESSSYAMLRAIFMKDRETYDKVWKWTKKNLQHSQLKYVYHWKDDGSPLNGWKTPKQLGIDNDHLFAWRWTPSIADRDGDGIREDGIIYYRWQKPTKGNDPNEPWKDGYDAASDADEDIALSLIFAHKLWGSKKGDKFLDYEKNAREIVGDIWKKETYINNNDRYFAGGDNIKDIEPGYLSPFTYRIFDDFDPEHNWMDVVDSSYKVFEWSSVIPLKNWTDNRGYTHNQDPRLRKKGPRPNLLPDWVSVDKDGNFQDGLSRREPEFGTDAFRGLWRIAVDYDWSSDERAQRYLKRHSKTGPYDFLYYKMHDRKGDWEMTDNYDETKKLASVYWHDGAYNLYESNYEPDDINENYVPNANDSRANCAQYGAYLSYFWASYLTNPTYKTFSMIEKLVTPLITPEADGFSKREYVIPEDRLANETAANIAKQVPLDIVNPKDDIGTPYSDGDGWYSKSSNGGYWTVFDHSEWNGQMDYFSSTWAWFGLAHFAGLINNYYEYENDIPNVLDFDLYLDPKFNYKVNENQPIKVATFYVKAVGEDKNPIHRDFFYLDIESNQAGADTIVVKVVETGKNTGVYTGKASVGLKSSEAADMIAASVGKKIKLIVHQKPSLYKIYNIGKIIIPTLIEDFENGAYNDANPLAWWTDSIFPGSGKPTFVVNQDAGIYIWRDTKWHIRFLAGSEKEIFHGMILTDGKIRYTKGKDLEGTDHLRKLERNIDLSFSEIQGMDGIDFTVDGSYVVFDIKRNGVYDLESFKIGAESLSAFGAPLVLRNYGETGTYKLHMSDSIAYDSDYALKIDKEYIGKSFPYLGAVIFEEAHKDWTQFDELEFDVYLKKDVGTIRVDIQDADGTVAILNGYNPWNKSKGPGWYKWRSNNPYGVDVNADLVQPFAIRYRNWWKGWSFDKGRNIDRTNELDLTSIRNVMFCVHGGAKDSSDIVIDNLTLKKANYYYGFNSPKTIYDIEFYKDKEYTELIEKNSVLGQYNLYIQVRGKDSSKDTIDRFKLNIETTDEYDGCDDIKLEVVETDINSGVYRGHLRVGVFSDFAHRTLGASAGNTIKVYSDTKKGLARKLKVGDFILQMLLDDFDDIAAGISPESWWVDNIDPTDGKPIYPAGKKLGYYLWKQNNKWLLRWSADQKSHNFYGSLKSDGNINILSKYNLEDGDYVVQKTPKHVKFNAFEKFAEDGIDFYLDGTFVEVAGYIDGVKYPDKTYVGPNEWNKAYTIPFIVKNYGKTKSYDLLITNKFAVSPPNSMRIKKTFFSKDYPYLGKWGLSGDLKKWDDKNEFKMWIYLSEDVGDIQVDIEDSNRQTAILNSYNPYNADKGAGWYLWRSNYSTGRAVAASAIDVRRIKDRRFWKSYDTSLDKYIDVTDKFTLGNILNVELSIGGGEQTDSIVYVDNLYLLRGNKHIGNTNPKNIDYIKLYRDAEYKYEINEIINGQDIYVEIKGKDGDKNSKDNINIEIYSNDEVVENKSINTVLTETEVNTGKYRGMFKMGLNTYENEDIIGAAWGSSITIIPPVEKDEQVKYGVGLFDLIHVIDDFEDGGINDKYPVTWWISESKQNDKSYTLKVKDAKSEKVLDVSKRYRGDSYPYFGAWGLKNRFADWSDKEDFVIEMNLENNPGELRVDIEDQYGNKAVLNGFSAWDSEKGAGIYEWSAAKGFGSDAETKLLQVDKIRNRTMWKGWSDSYQRYIDVTDEFDFSTVRNVQFLLDSNGTTDQSLQMLRIYLKNKNYRIGHTRPNLVEFIKFYHDPAYRVEIAKDDNIKFSKVYIELTGEDGDQHRVDAFDTTVMIYPTGEDYYPMKARLTETAINTGVYRGMIDLGKAYSPMTLAYVKVKDKVAVEYDPKNKTRKYLIASLYEFNPKMYDDLREGNSGIWKYIIILLILTGIVIYLIWKKRKDDEEKSNYT